MNKIKVGISFLLGIVLFVNLTVYFTASTSLLKTADYQQLVQIKHLIWIFIGVYITAQVQK